MTDLNAALASNLLPILVGFGLLVVALLVVVVMQVQQIGRLRGRVESLTLGEEGETMQLAFDAHHRRVIRLSEEVRTLEQRAERLEDEGKRAFQRIGFVRYNPFDDTGGNQSFALALLDAEDDGVLISSLHARQMTRIYAKAVGHGVPEAAISDEEAEALRLARNAQAGRAVIAERAAAARPAAGSRGEGNLGRVSRSARPDFALGSAPSRPERPDEIPTSRVIVTGAAANAGDFGEAEQRERAERGARLQQALRASRAEEFSQSLRSNQASRSQEEPEEEVAVVRQVREQAIRVQRSARAGAGDVPPKQPESSAAESASDAPEQLDVFASLEPDGSAR